MKECLTKFIVIICLDYIDKEKEPRDLFKECVIYMHK